MTELSYAIIGTGAVGGLYGGRLQRAGQEVHFLLHSDFNHVRRHGLRIDSVNGNFRLPKVKAYHRASDMPKCDVTVITLKATANTVLPGILPRVAKPGGTVIIIQNGLGAEKYIADIVPKSTVLGGLSFLCCSKIAPGHIRHIDYGLLTLALYTRSGRPGGVIPVMKDIAADFSNSGTPVKLIEDLLLARWKKLVWNIPFNGLSVLLNASTLELVRNPHTRTLCHALMEETIRGAAAFGREIPAAFVKKMMRDTDRMEPYDTSMKLDFNHGKQMEVEAIYGAPLRAARSRGLSLPRMEMLYQALCLLNCRNKRQPHK
ncbi:MAG: 2-dehydropantoate 2-reductase [Lentisphaerae bacterium RIFOXYA12_FULL_48_11]|nr:MAG: 2-dehydropantoate 2-reductase [Lentisphaerae bacterium RIFOXYA12_FULL_48_11]